MERVAPVPTSITTGVLSRFTVTVMGSLLEFVTQSIGRVYSFDGSPSDVA